MNSQTRIAIVGALCFLILSGMACQGTDSGSADNAASQAGAAGGVWSPEAADLLFMSNRDGNGEIYLLAAGASDWTNLTNHPAEDNWPEWSPDGARIAFQSNRSGNLDIWVMNADGSNPVQLTTNAAHDYVPAWTPDGVAITFTSWRNEPGDRESINHIYIMNADGSNQRRLLAWSPGTSTAAVASPTGQGYLLAQKGDQGTHIVLLSDAGEVVTRFTDDKASNGSPVFSPDGSRIAFYAEHGGKSQLIVMNADGTGRKSVVTRGLNWYPRWSPDGRWLVYTASVPGSSREDLDVLAINVEERGEPVTLAGGPGREAEGRWRPVQQK